MQDVALLSIGVVQECQPRRAVRVVFDGGNARGNALLLAAKIDRAVLLLMPAAAVPDGDLAMRVAPASALARLDQRFLGRLFGDFALIEHGHKAPRGCVRIETFQRHKFTLFQPAPQIPAHRFGKTCRRNRGLQIVRVLDHLLAGGELHVGLLPIAPVSFGAASPAKFSVKHGGANVRHFHLEDLLNGFLDLRLRRAPSDLKHNRVLGFLHTETFLGDNWPPNHLKCADAHDLALRFSLCFALLESALGTLRLRSETTSLISLFPLRQASSPPFWPREPSSSPRASPFWGLRPAVPARSEQRPRPALRRRDQALPRAALQRPWRAPDARGAANRRAATRATRQASRPRDCGWQVRDCGLPQSRRAASSSFRRRDGRARRGMASSCATRAARRLRRST